MTLSDVFCNCTDVKQTTVDPEEDMYDNAAYSSCEMSHSQQGPQSLWKCSEASEEVVYSQPTYTALRGRETAVIDSVEYQEPTPPDRRSVPELEKREGKAEEEAYHKFINPLYTPLSLNSTL